MKRRRRDVDSLNRQGEELKERGAAAIVDSDIAKLNKRLHDVGSQLAQYQRPAITASSPAVNFMSGAVTRSAAGLTPVQFIAEVQRLLVQIHDLQLQLASPQLSGRDFEDFSKQEDKLKV